MDAVAYTDSAVISFITDNLIPLRIKADDPVLGAQFKIKWTPSLHVLDFANNACKNIRIKSGLMLGLGEKKGEVLEVLKDLLRVGCEMVTIGQYLRPSKNQLPVQRFLEPEEFKEYEETARALGFPEVFSGPFVRSSYCIV